VKIAERRLRRKDRELSASIVEILLIKSESLKEITQRKKKNIRKGNI
jgi:hypothetical protein